MEGGFPVIETSTPPDLSQTARFGNIRYGYPEGEDPIPPIPHPYSEAEMALASPRTNAFWHAMSEVSARVNGAGTWLEAARDVEAFTVNMTGESRGAPSYLVKQFAVAAVMNREDFPVDGPLSTAQADVLKTYLDVLVRTRSGNIDMGAALVQLLADHEPLARRRGASERLLENDARYDESMREMYEFVTTSCEECASDPFVQDIHPDRKKAPLVSARQRLADTLD